MTGNFQNNFYQASLPISDYLLDHCNDIQTLNLFAYGYYYMVYGLKL